MGRPSVSISVRLAEAFVHAVVSLSSYALNTWSALAPAVAETIVIGSRVMWNEGVEGVGPRSRCTGRAAAGSNVERPFLSGSAREENVICAGARPTAFA